jgi:hypothetical protein
MTLTTDSKFVAEVPTSFYYALPDECHDIGYTEKCHDIVHSSLRNSSKLPVALVS